MVMALRGTCCSPKKSLAASSRVTRSRYTARVRLSRPDLQHVNLKLPLSSGYIAISYAHSLRNAKYFVHPDTMVVSCAGWESCLQGMDQVRQVQVYIPLLIEANVAHSAQSQQLQVYPTRGLNGSLVLFAMPAPRTEQCY